MRSVHSFPGGVRLPSGGLLQQDGTIRGGWCAYQSRPTPNLREFCGEQRVKGGLFCHEHRALEPMPDRWWAE
jgi:hypothetical protein